MKPAPARKGAKIKLLFSEWSIESPLRCSTGWPSTMSTLMSTIDALKLITSGAW